jgi:hypothetical protein
MNDASLNGILETAAKTLAWELYSAAAYGRTRARVNVKRFESELLTAVRRWRATTKNLNRKRRTRNGTRNV